MVVAVEDKESLVEKVAETVAVVERPAYQKYTVYSELVFSDKRRHKEQIDFRPRLHPVRHADTAYIWLNNTRRRFVSRTYYEPRLKPSKFSDTTFARPPSTEQRYAAFLDIHGDEQRKWYTTSVEIKPRSFTSAKVIRSANNNYIGTDDIRTSPQTLTTHARLSDLNRIPDQDKNENGNESDHQEQQADVIGNHWNGLPSPDNAQDRLAEDESYTFSEYGQNRSRSSSHDPGSPCSPQVMTDISSEAFRERLDPGSSQVFIPQRLKTSVDQNSYINGDLLIDVVNGELTSMDRDGVGTGRFNGGGTDFVTNDSSLL